jgi:hypothetical protein
MVMLALLNPAIQIMVAIPLLFLAMILMLVPKMNVIPILDVPIVPLIVMITTNVPMITALQIGVVIMKYTNVNTKVLALLLLVILTGDVCMMKLTVKMTTHVPLKLVMITALLLLLVNTLKLFAMMTTNAHKTIAALHPVVSLKMFLTNAGLIISVW